MVLELEVTSLKLLGGILSPSICMVCLFRLSLEFWIRMASHSREGVLIYIFMPFTNSSSFWCYRLLTLIILELWSSICLEWDYMPSSLLISIQMSFLVILLFSPLKKYFAKFMVLRVILMCDFVQMLNWFSIYIFLGLCFALRGYSGKGGRLSKRNPNQIWIWRWVEIGSRTEGGVKIRSKTIW